MMIMLLLSDTDSVYLTMEELVKKTIKSDNGINKDDKLSR